MALQVRPEAAAPARETRPGLYARCWRATAATALIAFVTIAVVQTPRLPLLALASGLAVAGGLMAVDAPVPSRRAWQEFCKGAGVAALALLVLVGAGHHLTAGLTTLALLAATSPWTLRYIAGE